MELHKPTATFFLDTRRSKSGDKFPLKLTIYRRPDKKRYGTAISLTSGDWEKIQNPKLKDQKLKDIRIEMTVIMNKANKILEKLEPFSFELFEKRFYTASGVKVDLTLKHWFDSYINELEAQGREGTRTAYQTALNSLLAFKPNLKLTDVTKDFLEDYETYMRKESKSPSTIGIYLRELRAIFNRVIKAGIIKQEQYPFKDYSIPGGRNIKKALTEKQLMELFQYKPKTKAQSKALDFWKLSYLCNGMNMTDIVNLKPENIQSNFLFFTRQKTLRTKKKDLRPIKVPLHKEAIAIINRWRSNDKDNPFLFSILKSDLTPKSTKGRIRKFIRETNDEMDKVRLDLGFQDRLGTYVARHSFSTMLMRKGAPTQLIKESLGHSSVSVTENYLGDFGDDIKIDYTNLLTDFKIK